ncbi:Ig-like domain-containing protein [Alloalcanivorax gelatiniphagus]|uniref:Ig-like domain-containing protein n=1 Tax=Alloalcanivorax gelatiniphagus TaxID=1194167 RepID=UPI003616B5C3
MNKLIIAGFTLALSACGGGGGSDATGGGDTRPQSLIYAFPADQQQQVVLPSPVVLRFSSAITDPAPQHAVTVRDADDNLVDVTASLSADRRSLILTSADDFAPRSHYQVHQDSLALEKGAAPARTLSFDTRAREEGPANEVAADTFTLLRRIPDGTRLQIVDFSSFRLQFSQPLATDAIAYGDNVRLVDSDNTLVDAVVLSHGPYLTVDPVEDLSPGEQYTLELTPRRDQHPGPIPVSGRPQPAHPVHAAGHPPAGRWRQSRDGAGHPRRWLGLAADRCAGQSGADGLGSARPGYRHPGQRPVAGGTGFRAELSRHHAAAHRPWLAD